jgi:2-iminobutanoate/2-iminopropanoate deaminase
MSEPTKEIVPVPELEDSSPFGYSQCVRSGQMVFIDGQCGLGDDHEIVSLDFEDQARRALARVEHAVRAAGGSLADIVSMTVFITDTRQGRLFTAMRREYFADGFPASALIGVSSLMPVGALIEIQAVAVVQSNAPSHRNATL